MNKKGKGKGKRAVKARSKIRRRTPLPPRLCASSVCPDARVFTPTRTTHVYCSEACADYERLKAWRVQQKEKEKAGQGEMAEG